MKKVLIAALLAIIAFIGLRFITPEDTWICENGTWIKHGNPALDRPTTPCQSAPKNDSITLLFNNLNDTNSDCVATEEVKRQVSDNSLNNIMFELFKGPSIEEKQAGFTSFFSDKTTDILINTFVKDSVAYVNIRDIRAIIPNASSSCGSASLLSQIEKTAKLSDSKINKVIVAINGDPKIFYDWLQIGCSIDNNNCDTTPFNQ